MACLLAQQNQVFAVNRSQPKVDSINRRMPVFADAEIERFFATKQLDLKAGTSLSEAYSDADYLVIATPTDYDEQLNHFDTSSIEQVIDQAEQCFEHATIVIKSTLPVGYTEAISSQHPRLDILFSPEFLREGRALYDNLNPSRIIVGVPKERSDLHDAAMGFASMLAEAAAFDELSSPIEAASIPQLIVGATEAEATKLFANTYLALRVSFFNELDTFAEMRGLDAAQIIDGVCLDERIGDFYNNPSFGYGGYCLPKDTKQLLMNYTDIPQDLIRAIVQANQTRMDFIVRQVAARSPRLVGIHRLIMKHGSDNFRQSSILGIMDRLRALCIPFVVFEPHLDEADRQGLAVIDDLEQFKQACDLIITNRMSAELDDVSRKVYSRDLWRRD
jgi:UDPglucose 6-dehydrogenase